MRPQTSTIGRWESQWQEVVWGVAFLLVIKAHERSIHAGAEALRIQYARLNFLTATTLRLGVVDNNLWRYVVGEEWLEIMKDGWSLGLLALDAMWLFAKTPEEGVLTQEYLATMSNNVIKGAIHKEMKEKGDLPWFTKDNTKARVL